MKKYIFILVIFSQRLYAQNQQMDILLEERRLLYNAYQEALDQKSGFFGNQNKTDLAEINEVLKKIIKKDNEILETLDKVQTHEYQQLQTQYNNLLDSHQALENKQKAIEKKLLEERNYQKQNHRQIDRAEGDKIFFGLVSFGLIFWLIILFTKLQKYRRRVKSLENALKKFDT